MRDDLLVKDQLISSLQSASLQHHIIQEITIEKGLLVSGS